MKVPKTFSSRNPMEGTEVELVALRQICSDLEEEGERLLRRWIEALKTDPDREQKTKQILKYIDSLCISEAR